MTSSITIPLRSRNSIALTANATRDATPSLFRRMAIVDAMNATGTLEMIRLGPSQERGWPQQNVVARPKLASGTPLSTRAMIPDIATYLRQLIDPPRNRLTRYSKTPRQYSVAKEYEQDNRLFGTADK